MRKFTFFSVFIIVAIAVLYSDNNNTIFDDWYKKDAGEISLFGKAIHTLEMTASEDNNAKYLVFYDENKHGMYCNKIERKKKLYICTPMEVKNKKLYPEEYLQDVIKESNSSKGLFAHIEMDNFLFAKILKIDISSLDKSCIEDIYCERSKMDSYIIFNYDFLKRLYSSYIFGIE